MACRRFCAVFAIFFNGIQAGGKKKKREAEEDLARLKRRLPKYRKELGTGSVVLDDWDNILGEIDNDIIPKQ